MVLLGQYSRKHCMPVWSVHILSRNVYIINCSICMLRFCIRSWFMARGQRCIFCTISFSLCNAYQFTPSHTKFMQLTFLPCKKEKMGSMLVYKMLVIMSALAVVNVTAWFLCTSLWKHIVLADLLWVPASQVPGQRTTSTSGVCHKKAGQVCGLVAIMKLSHVVALYHGLQCNLEITS